MKICKTIDEVRERRRQISEVGFVPTMGFLHEGHLSLIRRAKAENKAVAVSIFVNPTQFGPNEDFESYPRDLERDLALLRQENVDFVFIPESDILYPKNFVSKISVGGVALKMEGALRPGHFDGVALIVNKLFNIIQPDRAYFGQKDAQQCAVIKKLVRDFNHPCSVIIVPTSREEDGLARSSRNIYLSEEERKKAPAIYKALQEVKALFAAGERNKQALEEVMVKMLHQYDIKEIDYAVIVDYENFETFSRVSEKSLALIAVKFSKARLIDNALL